MCNVYTSEPANIFTQSYKIVKNMVYFLSEFWSKKAMADRKKTFWKIGDKQSGF